MVQRRAETFADYRRETGGVSGQYQAKEQADFRLFCWQKAADLLDFSEGKQGDEICSAKMRTAPGYPNNFFASMGTSAK
jgi:hypothetical protein